MEPSDLAIVIGYGVQTQSGVFRCIDCDHVYEKRDVGAMPPCPRYLDSTHARAGWRAVVAQAQVQDRIP
jgi:hypothetical protein